ncbi:MAG: hypothetical protein PHO85_07015, partial [Candidatus Cloacimonetes bacterium]|nr:hypothetical protein [Candidatus Cloacimonadota bacterium]
MNKIMIATSCLTLIFGGWLFAQNTAQYIQEKVSMSEMTHINNAVRILENFSEEEEGKKLINLSSYNGNINVPIQNMQWRQALELIALQNKLVLEEGVGYLAFRDTKESVIAAANALEELDPETKQLVEDALTKQVRIKAVAMLADRSYLKNLGIDWSSVFNGKVTVKAGFAGASQLSSPLTLSGSGTADVSDYSVD